MIEIKIPNTVKNIGHKAFTSLHEITIDPYSTNIESDSFSGSEISTLNIYEGTKTIKQYDYNKFFVIENDSSRQKSSNKKPQIKNDDSNYTQTQK